MSTDQLILGGIVFDSWSTPESIPFGGDQALKVHKLPGGSRVIDILGPDEMDIAFKGIFWNEAANAQASALNDLRLSGSVVSLTYGGNYYEVIVKSCPLTIHKFPQYYEYNIVCVVANNPMAGNLGSISSSFVDLVSADLATALSIVGF
jgi:hypothetical protein